VVVVVWGRKSRRDCRGTVAADPAAELILRRLACFDEEPSDMEPIAESAGVEM